MTLVVDDKKEKKKAQIKKNRRLQEIFNVMRLQRDEAERVEELTETLMPSPATPASKVPSDKVAVIRSRLTHSKRVSRERWNRFAGTGDAGARGL